MSNTLHIVIVDGDRNASETMISTIKSAGYAVRSKRAEDAEDLSAALNGQPIDLVLCALDTELINLEQTVQTLHAAKAYAPVLALDRQDSADVVQCMQHGADDVVKQDNPEHLKLVVGRIAQHQAHRRELAKARAALAETERRCRTLLDSSRDSICYVHEGIHIYANRPYLELCGYSEPEELDGVSIMELVAPDDRSKMKEFLRKYGHTGSDEDLEIQLQHSTGNPFNATMEFSSASMEGEPCTQIIIRDQTDSAALDAKLNYLSERDLATGLYNRKYIFQQLEKAIQQAHQGQANIAVIQIDIANLNDIKDAFGVAAIDIVVAETAKVLQAHCRESDLIGRFGDDSFIVITRHCETSALLAYGRAFYTAVNQHISEVNGKSVVAKPCAGAVQLDAHAPDVNEVLLRAKNAAEQAWEIDSDEVVIYTPSQDEMSQKQIDEAWTERLEDAIANNRLRLLFQPIISLRGDPGERFEVYVQLLDDEGKPVSAGEFLPSTERTGFAKILDRWVITTALQRLGKVRQGGKDTRFFIKLTAGSLQDDDMSAFIAEQLQKNALPQAKVAFNIKEPVAVNYLKQAKKFIKDMQEMKFKVSIDDFGTGLNPLQILKALPADYLKLDKSLIRNLSQYPDNQETIKSLAETARQTNKIVIAQFVEDADTLSLLWGMGINFIQGSFIQGASTTLDYDFSTMG